LTQEFFAQLLETNSLSSVDPGKGKFRSFLLSALKHFSANEWDRTRAQKRGGKYTLISLDEQAVEHRYSLEPVDRASPEEVYEESWALTVLEQALVRLKEEYLAGAKSELFDELKPFLSSEALPGVYATKASQLQMSTGAVAVAVHRMRQRYGECLRAEIARTVNKPTEVQDEMRHLFNVINH